MVTDHQQDIDGQGHAGQQGNNNQQTQNNHYHHCSPGKCWQKGKLKWSNKIEVLEFVLLIVAVLIGLAWLGGLVT